MTERETETAEIRAQLKRKLVEHLNLQDITPDRIGDETPLFGEGGVGLDSLDAVEIVVILQRHFGVEIQDMEVGRKVFQSVRTLADYVYDKKHG